MEFAVDNILNLDPLVFHLLCIIAMLVGLGYLLTDWGRDEDDEMSDDVG